MSSSGSSKKRRATSPLGDAQQESSSSSASATVDDNKRVTRAMRKRTRLDPEQAVAGTETQGEGAAGHGSDEETLASDSEGIEDVVAPAIEATTPAAPESRTHPEVTSSSNSQNEEGQANEDNAATPTETPAAVSHVAPETGKRKRAASQSEEADVSPDNVNASGASQDTEEEAPNADEGDLPSDPQTITAPASDTAKPSIQVKATTASRKRIRLDSPRQEDGEGPFNTSQAEEEPATLTKTSPLLTIPVEIFTEILLYTKSLKDVLAIASTCKAFCHTLLQPSSTFIWKYVRENNTPVPPPDYKTAGFEAQFTEVSYAAFVFGGGTCEGCGKETPNPFTSYALRIRVCQNKECEDKFVQKSLLQSATQVCGRNNLLGQQTLLPTLEDRHIGFKTGKFTEYFTRTAIPAELKSFLVEDRDKPDFRKKLGVWRAKQQMWMDLCRSLIRWRRSNKDLFYTNKRTNNALGIEIAKELGWEFKDMMNCTDYGPYHNRKNHLFERVDRIDVKVLEPKIEEQLMRVAEKRDRRLHEVLYQGHREQILQHYKYLQSSKAFLILPALTAFRQLPVIAMLQSTEGEEKTEASHVAKSLKTDTVLMNMLKTQINGWANKARNDFGLMVGCKRWKSISRAELHPAERMSARFKCKRCKVYGDKYVEDECFDFAGACAHDCSKPGKKNKGNWKWEASHFEKDEKASAAISKYLDMCKLQDKAASTAETVSVLQAANYVVCKSCESPIIMKFNNLIGHSHRHKHMDFSVITNQTEVDEIIGKYPFQTGLTQKLVKSTQKAKGNRDMKVYGCRLCYNKHLADFRQEVAAKAAVNGEQTESSASASEGNAGAKSSDGEGEDKHSPLPTWFSFDGLRSHLMAKHTIPDIRDEDYFTQ